MSRANDESLSALDLKGVTPAEGAERLTRRTISQDDRTACLLLQSYYEQVFLPKHLANCAPKVVRSYAYSVDLFIFFCRRQHLTLVEVTAERLEAFANWVIATKRGKKVTAATHVKRLRRIANIGLGILKESPSLDENLPNSLREFFEDIYVRDRPLRPQSVRQLRMSINAVNKWHGRPALLSDLSDDFLNRWLVSMETKWAPKTIRRRRGDILSVWRHAVVRGVVEIPPLWIRKIKVPQPVPEAWTLGELRMILMATKRLPRWFPNGIQQGQFWAAFVHTAYDTGLRQGDLLSLRRKQIAADGRLTIVQSKTLQGHVCRVRPDTLAAIDAIFPPARSLIFAWPYCREVFYTHWRKLLMLAGLPTGRHQGMQKLRRTSATHLERVAPGYATVHLGHRSADLAKRHYIDASIAYRQRPLPPPVDDESTADAPSPAGNGNGKPTEEGGV